MPPALSYLTVTKNKLPYLKQRLEKLIAQKKDSEEILVADGASTDGTREYLEQLKRAGKIDGYISEPDYCESHALNKLFLIAAGTLIKIINDDDVYYFPAIQACKQFMLAHPNIDILGTEGGSFKHDTPSTLVIRQVAGYTDNYLRWQKDHTPFEFAGVGIMFRRSSLPILGFWNLSFRSADTEYTFRVTAGKAHVAWYTGSAFVYIKNAHSTVWAHRKKVENEIARLRKFYLNEDSESQTVKKSKVFARKLLSGSLFRKKEVVPDFPTDWSELEKQAENWLLERSNTEHPQFLWKK